MNTRDKMASGKSVASPSALYESAEAYIKAAVDLLRPHLIGQSRRALSGVQEWVTTSPGFFVQRAKEIATAPIAAIQHWDQLHSLKEYLDLSAVLASQPEIAEQMNVLVGTELSATRVDPEHIAYSLLFGVIDRLNDDFNFDEAIFKEELDQLYSGLCRPEFELVTVAPLLGLKMARTPVAFGSQLEIDKLSDSEITRCLDGNLFTSPPVIWGTAPLVVCNLESGTSIC